MRISDWSSDVCSSDLVGGSVPRAAAVDAGGAGSPGRTRPAGAGRLPAADRGGHGRMDGGPLGRPSSATKDRKCLVWGQRVSVSVHLGGRRLHNKTKNSRKIDE